MSGIEAIVGHAEAWAQEELGSQKRLLVLLEEQRDAVARNDTAGLLETTARIEREIADRAWRNERLRALLAAFAGQWGIDPGAVSLGSVCERLGARGARLARLRAQLVDATRAVSGAGRRMVALARLHQGVQADLVRALARALGAGEDTETGGRLLLVEA